MNGKAQSTLILVGVGLLIFLYVRKDAADAVRRLGPTANDNYVYTGVNEVGESLTGDENFSFGVWLWELANPEKVEAGL